MEVGRKGLLTSKTFWGVVVGLLAGRLRPWFGIDLSQDELGEVAENLAVIAAAGLALYGRIAAKRTIQGL